MAKKAATKKKAAPSAKTAKQPRYVVEKNPNGHVNLWNVVDTDKPAKHPNRIVKDYGREIEAKERAAQLNKQLS